MKTKHLIIVTIMIASWLPSMLHAQVTVGTRHGITVSTLSKPGNLYDNDNLTASYTGGLFAVIRSGKTLQFQPEVNFIRKGRCNDNITIGSTSETTSKYSYLQIPVLARFAPGALKYNHSSVFFNAGPYASILLKSEMNLTNNGELPSVQTENDKKSPDWGIIVGGGVETKINKLKLQFDLRYDLGLSKLDNQPDKYRTKALSLAAGIIF